MTSTLIVTGSPSSSSRTHRLAGLLSDKLTALDVPSSILDLRSLPAEDLLHARFDAPRIVEALGQVAAASSVVFATPVYKAAYSGLLKTFLDILPQFGLRDKVVFPLATGGTFAHVLAVDYALRPVLSSLDPLHVVSGLFVLDKHILVQDDGSVTLDKEFEGRFDLTIASFAQAIRRAGLLHPPANHGTLAAVG
jgi:FMN reductase